jgi:hypothetical protein
MVIAVKIESVLEECTTEKQLSVVRFLAGK